MPSLSATRAIHSHMINFIVTLLTSLAMTVVAGVLLFSARSLYDNWVDATVLYHVLDVTDFWLLVNFMNVNTIYWWNK